MQPDTEIFGRLRAGEAHLRLIATSDLHGNLLGYDYLSDCPAPGAGLAALAPVMARLRTGPGATLLFDNGDILQGTPLAETGTQAEGPMPVAEALRALGYDAATLGNHDFDFGLAAARRFAAEAAAPVVLGNVAGADGTPFLPPFAVLEREIADGAGARHPLRVGVLGLTTPGVARWNAHHFGADLQVEDMAAAARRRIPELRAAGAEVVIVLAHAGIDPEATALEAENAALAVAEVEGIDALVAGHTHLAFPGRDHAAAPGVDPAAGRLHGVPAAMPGAGGRSLGVIELALARDRGRWRATGGHGRLAHAGGDAGAAPLLNRLAPAQAATVARIRRPAGRSRVALHTHFAALGRAPAVQAVAEAQRLWLAEAVQGTTWESLPVVSAAAPFRAGGLAGPGHFTDIPPGPLLTRHLNELYPFPNELRALVVTGTDLRRWLARAAALFGSVAPGARDAPLLAAGARGYMLDMIAGVTAEIDLAAPPEDPARLRRVVRDGQEVAPDARFLLATNSHRLGAGEAPAEAVVPLPRRVANRETLDALAARGPLDPDPTPAYAFAPMPGATAVLATTPAARRHLDAITSFAPEDMGTDGDGFLRLRLHL